MAIKFKAFGISVLLFVLLSVSVSAYSFIDSRGNEIISTAADVKDVPKGVIGVTDSWEKANVKVFPAIAQSWNGHDFTQTVELCNRDAEQAYYWFSPTYKDLKSFEMLAEKVIAEPKSVMSMICYLKNITVSFYNASKGSNQTGIQERTLCDKEYQSNFTNYRSEWEPVKNEDYEVFIKDDVSVTTKQGFLLKKDECKNVKIHYITFSQSGKWDLNIYGNTDDDVGCILDSKCPISYTLDPWYDGTSLTMKRTRQLIVGNSSFVTGLGKAIPVMINFSTAFCGKGTYPCRDYIPTNTSTAQLLPYQFDWNTTSQAFVWVLQDIVNNTITYDVFNDSTITSDFSNASIWGNGSSPDGYVFVWHANNMSIDGGGKTYIGTTPGAPVYQSVSAGYGREVYVDATDDCINFGSDPHYANLASGTVVVWYRSTGESDNAWLSHGDGQNIGAGWTIEDDGANGATCFVGMTGGYKKARLIGFGTATGTPQMAVCTWGNGSLTAYVNGTATASAVATGTYISPYPTYSLRVGCTNTAANATAYRQDFWTDELRVANRSMNATEVAALYSMMYSTRGIYNIFGSAESLSEQPVFPITFISQQPADLSTTNLFNSVMNISYNISSFFVAAGAKATVVNVTFNYTTNSTFAPYFYFVNGTGFRGYVQTNQTVNTTDIYNLLLYDNDVYPGTYNLNNSIMRETAHHGFLLNSSSTYLKMRLFNVSNNSQYGMFEFMGVNKTGSGTSLPIYYCNSSYPLTNGSPATSASCTVFVNVPSGTNANHSHSANSYHIVVPFAINTTGGTIGSVRITAESYFLFRGANPTNRGWNISYISDVTTPETAEFTANNGNTWSNALLTPDSHLHQYYGNDTFYYLVCAQNLNGTSNCSSTRSDFIDLAGIPPTAPNVYSPVGGASYDQDIININYTPAISPNGYKIVLYNISLVTPDEVFVSTVQSNNSILDVGLLNYSWNASTTPNGDYKIRVQACDSLFQCSYGYSDLFSLFKCGDGINLTTSYELNSTIKCSGSAFRILANDVALDCNGYFVYWNTDGIGEDETAVNLSFAQRTVINECHFIDNTSTGGSHGVWADGAGGPLIIENSSITPNNTAPTIVPYGIVPSTKHLKAKNIQIDAYNVPAGYGINSNSGTANIIDTNITAGIALNCEGSDYINITNSYLNSTSGSTFQVSGGLGTFCNHLDFYNSSFITNGSFASTGINLYNSNDIKIRSNRILLFTPAAATTNHEGIYLSFDTSYVNITNNTIILNDTTPTSSAINVQSANTFTQIANNSITIDNGAGTNAVGIRLQSTVFGSSSGLYLFGNRIENRVGTANTNYGISIEGTLTHTNILIEDSEIHLGNGAGIHTDDVCTNCNIYQSTITNEEGYGLNIAKSSSLINFTNTSIRAGKWAYFNIGAGGIAGLTNVTFFHSNGGFIQYPLVIADYVGIQDITQDVMNFTGDYAFMNASLAPDLNTTAIISFVPAPAYDYAIVLADYGDTGTKQLCTDCNWLAYSAGLIAVFNVSHWTNYSLGALNAGECSISANVINATASEFDNQSAIINMSHPISTTVGGEFWYPTTTNLSNNITYITSAQNATHYSTVMRAQYTTPIINVNGTVIANNWHTYCFLPNGSIFNATNTTSASQTLYFAYGFANQTWSNNIYELTNQTYGLNLSSSIAISYFNVSFISLYGTVTANASMNYTASDAGLNYTVFNVSNSRMPLVSVNNTNNSFYFYITAIYLNGSTKQFNTTVYNQSVWWAFIPNIPTAPNALETESFWITANLSKLGFVNTSIAGQIDYNGTNITTTPSFDDTYSYLVTALSSNNWMAKENTTMNFTVTWLLNDTASGSYAYRAQNGSHLVQQFNLTLCNAGSVPSLNISFFDLTTMLPLSTTTSYMITFAYIGTATPFNKTRAFYWAGNASDELCILPVNGVFQNTLQLQANRTGYIPTIYNQINRTRSNVTENISIYMTPIGGGLLQNITIEIVDQDENPLTQHTVEAWYYNPLNVSYLLVATDLTDINGMVRFELNTYNTLYRFIVRDQSGKIILTTITFKLLQTSYRFVIPLVQYDMLQQIQTFGNFNYYNLTYNNVTGNVLSDLWDSQNITSQLCTKIRKIEPLGNNTWLLDGCSLNKTAHYFLNISLYGNGTYQALSYAYTNSSVPTPYTIATLDIVTGTSANIIFKTEGLLITFFVILLLGGIGMTGSPALLIIASLVALGLMVVSGMFVMGWGVLLGIIFAGILLILKSRS